MTSDLTDKKTMSQIEKERQQLLAKLLQERYGMPTRNNEPPDNSEISR